MLGKLRAGKRLSLAFVLKKRRNAVFKPLLRFRRQFERFGEDRSGAANEEWYKSSYFMRRRQKRIGICAISAVLVVNLRERIAVLAGILSEREPSHSKA